MRDTVAFLFVAIGLCGAIPFDAQSSFLSTVRKLPTHSRCQDLCPQCKENPPAPCKCDDKCWPGQGVDNTIDETCNCFAQLGFCADGEDPTYLPGEKCPSCWPKNNTACACFAAIGFCEPPAKLPTTSRCSTLCPKCKENPPAPCKCDACWPGAGLNATNDHTCECFAELGFCKEGEKPVYTPGKKCPSCWDPDNTACACFAAIGFCDAKPTPAAPPTPASKNIVELAASVPDLSTLVTALKAGKLTGALTGKGPFTVFAPTNEAFARLSKATLDYLLDPKNVKELQEVLELHVIAGTALKSTDLKPVTQETSLEGEKLLIFANDGHVRVNPEGTMRYVNVVKADNEASNGVVHIINSVLIPKGFIGPDTAPNCTKSGCIFSYTNYQNVEQGRCGEVDAAPRMPADIWNDQRAKDEYVRDTVAWYGRLIYKSVRLVQAPCKREGYVQRGSATVNWTSPLLMRVTCDTHCNCIYPKCPDVPDKPPMYCSLCGPKFNAPIEVKFWYPSNETAAVQQQ